MSGAVLAICVAALAGPPPSVADGSAADVPAGTAELRGRWRPESGDESAFRGRLFLGPQYFVQWHQDPRALPWDGAWFLDGGRLRIFRYGAATAGRRDPPVEELAFDYALSEGGGRLTLTRDGETSSWRRDRTSPGDETGTEPAAGPDGRRGAE